MPAARAYSVKIVSDSITGRSIDVGRPRRARRPALVLNARATSCRDDPPDDIAQAIQDVSA